MSEENEYPYDDEYPTGTAGFEVLYCKTLAYRKENLDQFKKDQRDGILDQLRVRLTEVGDESADYLGLRDAIRVIEEFGI